MQEPDDGPSAAPARHDDAPRDAARPHGGGHGPSLGAVLLTVGGVICLLATADSLAALPWRMPRSWYQFRAVWLGLGVIGVIAGFLMQRPPRGDEADTR